MPRSSTRLVAVLLLLGGIFCLMAKPVPAPAGQEIGRSAAESKIGPRFLEADA